jgi:short subunit dehydrogenase-like uncharacterized protein
MSTLAVVGAGGCLGSLVVAEAEGRGHDVVPVPRERLGTVADLAAELERTDAVVAACGDDQDGLALRVVDAAIASGRSLIDLEPGQAHVRRLRDERREPARTAGIALVPGAGLQHVLGDALTAVAAATVEVPAEVHVAYTLPARGAVLAPATPGRRRGIAAELGTPGVARHHGDEVEELPGEVRRLAWFPRPVGPSHAAAVPGGEALSVPEHLPHLRSVRTYVAVASWRAELLQATANAARWPPARRVLQRRLTRPRATPGPGARASTRWGCVSEVGGADGVARAWAYGHDPYRLSAACAVVLAEAVPTQPRAGFLAPAQVLPARELLDRLSERGDTRWSVARPAATSA